MLAECFDFLNGPIYFLREVAFGNNNIQDLIWAIVSITTGIL
jgi:hypothetical protein